MAERSWGGYYEQRTTLEEYLSFHYPDADPLQPLLHGRTPPLTERFPFAVRTLWEGRPDGRALDLGAACGRVTFDLARDHRIAFGIDLSGTLIRGAEEVRQSGRARYSTVVEGELRRHHDVAVDAPDNVRFLVGDALALPFADRSFATAVALNLIDRVPDPRRALREAERVLEPGGLLLVGSPYTWRQEHTPRENWLGGYAAEEGEVRGFETVRALLATGFELEGEAKLPFFIPHHARSGQLGLAWIQMFRRKV